MNERSLHKLRSALQDMLEVEKQRVRESARCSLSDPDDYQELERVYGTMLAKDPVITQILHFLTGGH